MGAGTLIVGVPALNTLAHLTKGLPPWVSITAVAHGFTASTQVLIAAPSMATLQAWVPPEARVRVAAVLGSMTSALGPLAVAAGGYMAERWGPGAFYVIKAAWMCVYLAGLLAHPALRRIRL